MLAELYGASVSGRVATGRRAGMSIARVGDEVDPQHGALPSGPCCASVAGFSFHAGVCVPAQDRLRLERLCRYAGRPPLAAERLSLLPDGRLLYRLKRRWRDGTTHVIYEPLELIERLAALVHPPRFNITRFYGIFAPAASLRPRVIPEAEASSPPRYPGCHSGVEAPVTDSGKTMKKRGCQPRNYAWATLMARVLELDVRLSALWRADENSRRHQSTGCDQEDINLPWPPNEGSAYCTWGTGPRHDVCMIAEQRIRSAIRWTCAQVAERGC